MYKNDCYSSQVTSYVPKNRQESCMNMKLKQDQQVPEKQYNKQAQQQYQVFNIINPQEYFQQNNYYYNKQIQKQPINQINTAVNNITPSQYSNYMSNQSNISNQSNLNEIGYNNIKKTNNNEPIRQELFTRDRINKSMYQNTQKPKFSLHQKNDDHNFTSRHIKKDHSNKKLDKVSSDNQQKTWESYLVYQKEQVVHTINFLEIQLKDQYEKLSQIKLFQSNCTNDFNKYEQFLNQSDQPMKDNSIDNQIRDSQLDLEKLTLTKEQKQQLKILEQNEEKIALQKKIYNEQVQQLKQRAQQQKIKVIEENIQKYDQIQQEQVIDKYEQQMIEEKRELVEQNTKKQQQIDSLIDQNKSIQETIKKIMEKQEKQKEDQASEIQKYQYQNELLHQQQQISEYQKLVQDLKVQVETQKMHQSLQEEKIQIYGKDLIQEETKEKIQDQEKNIDQNQTHQQEQIISLYKDDHDEDINDDLSQPPLLELEKSKSIQISLEQLEKSKNLQLERNLEQEKFIQQVKQEIEKAQQKSQQSQSISTSQNLLSQQEFMYSHPENLQNSQKSVIIQSLPENFKIPKSEIQQDKTDLNILKLQQSLSNQLQNSEQKAQETKQYLNKSPSFSFRSPDDTFGSPNKIDPIVLKEFPPANIENYHIQCEIGKGKFSVVYQALDKTKYEIVAIKVMKKSYIKQLKAGQDIINELEIGRMVNHKNLITIINQFEDQENHYIVTEFCQNGNLYNLLLLQPNSRFDESTIRKTIKEVIEALLYMHQNDIIHRDIKPENVFIDKYDNVRLGDFGSGVYCRDENKNRKTFCGTLDYISPEMQLMQEYDEKVDIWAIGVLTYELSTGQPPFPEINSQQTQQQIAQRKVIFHDYQSQDIKDFICLFLQVNTMKRVDLREALKHRFLLKY